MGAVSDPNTWSVGRRISLLTPSPCCVSCCHDPPDPSRNRVTIIPLAVSRHLVAAIADTHCGSQLGLCPPEGVEFSRGGRYLPNRGQQWSWECFEDFAETVRRIAYDEDRALHWIINGDLHDGDHHNTSEILSRNLEMQAYCSRRVLEVIRKTDPQKLYVVKGTETHGGPENNSETLAAFGATADRGETSQEWATWHLRTRIGGVLIDAQHHGRQGTRPWTMGSALQTQGLELWVESLEAGDDVPDLAIRADKHVYGYSGREMRGVPVVVLPPWQLKNAFGSRVAPNSRAGIGGVFVRIQDGDFTLDKKLYRPALPAIREVP